MEVSGWLAAAADTIPPVPARLSSALTAGEGAVGWEGAADVGATLSNNVTVRSRSETGSETCAAPLLWLDDRASSLFVRPEFSTTCAAIDLSVVKGSSLAF